MVAMVDRNDPYHEVCLAALDGILSDGFVTTWACLAEAMHLLDRKLGFIGQEHLWDLLDDGVIEPCRQSDGEWRRMRELMRKYRDAPMDLADASLVTAAEQLGIQRVFTIDRHFKAYRINGAQPFEIVP
jgi:predicted nucleic acid-binding protein